MELSYAQNMEDYHLWQALGHRTSGFYIDIGAGHPVADSVSFWFYERGWRGICVEPQPHLAALYAQIRPRDEVLQGLVGSHTGVMDFYVVNRLHALSTTVKSHAEAAAKYGASHRTVSMPVITLAQLCERYGVTEIDFLKIDVEGAEASILAGNDWNRFRPKVIVAEAVSPASGAPSWLEWEPHLLAQGYVLTLFDTLNRFYVAQEAKDTLAAAPRERAKWDAVPHLYQIGRAPECAGHPDYDLASELTRGFWASLPSIDKRHLASLLARHRGITDPDEVEQLAIDLETDRMRGALGRIACGYDGGQLWPISSDEKNSRLAELQSSITARLGSARIRLAARKRRLAQEA
ncbi:FkbM family methyltransferase [Hyphomicrobium sp.]|uniref:FkbM family methyltransferase n=1 Tax=Hyphomicrobium sp. TaxID=82 RepID=UPI001D846223|nr:FkbM family methyltransferase [Hyphomicrobium sp.]MBY0560491.1 FkbM family methyltransferase [Hyphomicrobium sp.]